MKKILFALAMLAFVLPALPRARADDMSIDFFYNNLSGGNWIEVADYGYGWQPDLAVNDPNWRPYADGYWAYTDDGWTWISYEDFGWATYHYGRWARLADYGWVWFPGSDLDWGPAWVSWRTGGDYVGWAPLPPRGPGIVYEGQPIGAQADIEFDIGPEYYNFVDVRFIGEPVLRDRIFAPSQNVTYINNTVNVTNISVRNNVVYNYGPDYNVLSAHSSRPIQRLSITRESATNLSAAAKSGALTKVQGGKLVVATPQKLTKSAPGAAPPSVKAKVAKPKIEKGWAGVPNEAQLKQKIKTENPKNIPPPTGAAAGRGPAGASPAATAPSAGGSPMASPAAAGSPLEKGTRGRPGGRVQPEATGTPGVTGSPMGSPATTGAPFERGKRKGRPGEPPQPSLTGTPARSPAGTASPGIKGSPAGGEYGRPGRGRFETSPTPPHGPPPRKSPPGQTGAAPAAPEATQPPSKNRGQFERGVPSPSPAQPGGTTNEPQGSFRGRGREQPGAAPVAPEATRPASKHRGQFERSVPSPSPAQPGGTTNEPQGSFRGRGSEQTGTAPPTTKGVAPYESPAGGGQRGQGAYGQRGGASGGRSSPGGAPDHEKPQGGKKKGKETSPTPGPQ
jgi:hypothetical protein